MYSIFGIFLIILGLAYVRSVDYVFYPEVNVSYKFHNTPLKWGEARLKCIEEKATLALPKNQDEVLVLKGIFEEHPASTIKGATYTDYILLRFHDLFAENEYLTDEGISLQYFHHEWNSGQPDNHNNEDCGSMHRSGKINDYPCDGFGVYICQKENKPYIKELLDNNIHMNLDIGYKYEPYSKKRFKLHLNPKPWDQARMTCQSEGGQLAVIESKQEEDFLVNMFNSPSNKVAFVLHKDYALLGIHDYFIEGNFVTTKGKPLNSLTYVRWNNGEPNNSGGNENCGSMNNVGALNDFPCSVHAIFFCEIKNIDIIDVRGNFS